MKLKIIWVLTNTFILFSLIGGMAFYEWLSFYIERKIAFPIGILSILVLLYSFNRFVLLKLTPKKIVESVSIEKNPFFLGMWKSKEGQYLWIISVSFLPWDYAFYKPKKGRIRTFMPCHYLDETSTMSVSLHLLGLMEAMLVLTPACSIEEKKEILTPVLESGPETDWMQDDMGFPWVHPLSIFQRA
jgi:hypothetical protein